MENIKIPKQLWNPAFRFCKIETKSKAPFEKNWQSDQNYIYNEPILTNWIENGNNYGCIGGYGNLRIIDCDKPEFADIISQKLNTFTVQTGSGGKHFYIISDYITNHVFIKEYGELRANKYQVVGPGSVHPSGNIYKIINDSEIAIVSYNQLLEIIKPYLKEQTIIPIDEIDIKELQKATDKSRSGEEFREVLKLIRKGLSKDAIFQDMMKYAKWEKAHISYKELTYSKAMNWYLVKVKTKTEKAIAEFVDYLDMAEKFIQIQPLYYDDNKCWWLWNFDSTSWEMTDEVDLMNLIDKSTLAKSTFKSDIKNQILECLKRKARLNRPEPIKESWIQFQDKIVDINTNEEFDVDSKYFAVNPIPWKIGETDKTPIIDIIFEEWVGTEYKNTLYELIAFSLVPEYFIHRIFCLIGSGSNGKTKYLNLVRNFLGKNNVASSDLDQLVNNRFESAKLYKKLVVMMGETNFNRLAKTSILKKATGQDPMSFEFKGKDGFTDLSYAKWILATNTLPVTLDKTEGYYRRWFIIDFNNKFDESKDILKDIPEEEYNNLARKCIKILNTLWKTRQFTNEGTIEQRMNIYEEKSNPLNLFILEECIKDIHSIIPFWEFYEAYIKFISERGYRIQTKNEVGILLNNEGFEKKAIKVFKNKLESTQRCIIGLKLKSKDNVEVFEENVY